MFGHEYPSTLAYLRCHGPEGLAPGLQLQDLVCLKTRRLLVCQVANGRTINVMIVAHFLLKVPRRVDLLRSLLWPPNNGIPGVRPEDLSILL
jgi:hypothetical protein